MPLCSLCTSGPGSSATCKQTADGVPPAGPLCPHFGADHKLAHELLIMAANQSSLPEGPLVVLTDAAVVIRYDDDEVHAPL